MIIKSMARKEPSFNQILDYMESGRADSRYTVHHNLFGRNPEMVKEEFVQNSRFLHRRVGGNYMYHEVISITRNHQLELDEQKEKLRQIVCDYIRDRAQNNLAYAALHDDKECNLHFHLIISANEVGSKKRHRLTKHQFDTIKKSLETKVLKHYPELKQEKIINKVSREKLSNKGAELKRRTGQTPQRDVVRQKVGEIFAAAQTREELLAAFDKAGLDFYIRGKAPGVVDRQTGRKHRIKTLGYLPQFEVLNQKIVADLKSDQSKEASQKRAADAPEEKITPKGSDAIKDSRVDGDHKAKAEETSQSEQDKIIEARRQEMKQCRSKSSHSSRKNSKSGTKQGD